MQVQGTCSFEYDKMILYMENPKEKIYSILQGLAMDLGVNDIEFQVNKPKVMAHGDLASNIALILSKNLKKPPFELAEELVEKIKTSHSDVFEKIEAVKPGFINFYLSKKYLASQVEKIIKEGSAYGSSDLGKGKKVSVEFVSANPTGPLHIGNARGGPLGDTIANVLSKLGYQVTREYLHNDVGGQVQKLGEAIYFAINPDKKPKDVEFQYQGEYVKELADVVSKKLGKDLLEAEFSKKAGEIAVELMLSEILKDCEAMGIKFDIVTKESDLKKDVPEALDKIKKFLKEKDGALWFAPSDEFLKDRETVVKKSDGEYTYFASDIAYHKQKMMHCDILIDILGANHSGHVPKLFAVVKALSFDPNNLKVVLYQWIRLKRANEIVKMSKRAGTFVTAKEVLDEVGKDAFRFFLIMTNSSTHMDFDLDLAKKKASDNPVFYVQYAHTRIVSIFKKAKSADFSKADLSLLKEPEEIDLIRKLIDFPDLVEEVSKTFAVNNLATFATELASFFHKFYEKQQVISEDEKLTEARLALLKATQNTLKNTLDLLGVSAPEEM